MTQLVSAGPVAMHSDTATSPEQQMTTTNTRLQGKTAVVTGATQGIGLESAKALAAMGARVIITARDAVRGEAAKQQVKAAGNGDVEVVFVDFASMASIREGATALKKLTSRIDILLNNAGAVFMERGFTKDGLEQSFGTNHMGYFLWTTELLDVIKASAPARIVNVSSAAHAMARNGLDFDDLLERKNSYSGMQVYAESKLANILFTTELARRLDGTGVTVNCLHPGVIASGFGTNNKGIVGFFTRHLSPLVLTSPAKGAATSVYLCSSPDVAGTTGGYFSNKKLTKTTQAATDVAAAARLWKLSEDVVARADHQAAA